MNRRLSWSLLNSDSVSLEIVFLAEHALERRDELVNVERASRVFVRELERAFE